MLAQMMLPRHQQAVERADLPRDAKAGASDDVRKLAADIKAAQDPRHLTLHARRF